MGSAKSLHEEKDYIREATYKDICFDDWWVNMGLCYLLIGEYTGTMLFDDWWVHRDLVIW